MSEEGDDKENNKRTVLHKSQLQLGNSPPGANISIQQQAPRHTNKTCKYFLSKRGCTFGADCKFTHAQPFPSVHGVERDEEVGEREKGKGHQARARPVCHFYVTSVCKYGDACTYHHPEGGRGQGGGRREGGGRPQWRGGGREERGGMDGGDGGKRGSRDVIKSGVNESQPLEKTLCEPREEKEEEEEDGAQILQLASFPGLRQAGEEEEEKKVFCRVPPSQPHSSPSHLPPSHSHTSQPPAPQKSRLSHSRSRQGPSELSLGAFLTTPTSRAVKTRPHVQRPLKNKPNTSKDLREVEVQQLELRFPGNQSCLVEKGSEKLVYQITVSPSDPDWKFNFKTIDLQLTFPANYPATPLYAELPADQKIPGAFVTHGNSCINTHLSSLGSGCGQLMLRPFLRWLDQNIVSIFKDAAKEMVAAELLTTSRTISARDKEEEEEEEGEDEGEDEGEQEEKDEDEEEEGGKRSFKMPAKKGTEIRLVGLVMGEGVGVVRCASVKLVLQCTRCRGNQDEIMKAEIPTARLCARCQHCFSFTFHPAIMHTESATVGFMDLHGCTPVDLVLMYSETTLSCVECGRDNTTSGLNFGEHRESWCRRCHTKHTLYVEQSRFIQHQTGVKTGSAPSLAGSKKSERKREPLIQIGKPLPEYGTCSHYKKSHRWLRFPCCGKPYPCDVCHDAKEDHMMERANRMICGFCCREQPYSSTRPCQGCGEEVVGGKAGTFWEGGKGCRNKSKMSRNDNHKYSESAMKTHSKKQERVGRHGNKAQAQKTTKT